MLPLMSYSDLSFKITFSLHMAEVLSGLCKLSSYSHVVSVSSTVTHPSDTLLFDIVVNVPECTFLPLGCTGAG